MDLDAFRSSLDQADPPEGLSLPVQALWWDGKGNWDKAHECAQADSGPLAAAVHAYLHRFEGDLPNAGYWYRAAGKQVEKGPLETEWDAIAAALLS